MRWINIAKIFIFLYVIINFSINDVLALDIVYPKSNGARVWASSTFFVGNVSTNNDLYINGEKIYIYPNGAFLKVVNLNYGINTFIFEEKDKSSKITKNKLDYKLVRPQPVMKASPKQPEENLCFNKIKTAKTSVDNIPLRAGAGGNYDRLTHLYKGVNLFIDFKKNDFYRVILDYDKYAWVNKNHIEFPVDIDNTFTAELSEIKFKKNSEFYKFRYKLDYEMPYIVEEEKDNILKLNIFGVYSDEFENIEKKFFSIKKTGNNVLTTEIELPDKLWGYDVYYDKDYLNFVIKRPPEINKNHPLKNIKIVIDPGHGGKESGAIGFTRIRECEINLDVAKKLKEILENDGAKVIMTRDDDSYLDLYERVEISRKANPHFLISLHANALPDGRNPFEKHGTSVFYYNQQSKLFAETVQAEMLNQMKTKDDGVSKNSLVMTRVPSSISVLIEMAYMIHPVEYQMLLDTYFQYTIAESIKQGIINYLLLE